MYNCFVSWRHDSVEDTECGGASATTDADDERVYAPGVIEKIKDSAILFVEDFDRLRPVIADRTQRLVPNTTCASCHKLNNTRFNFHNMSYLQDRFDMVELY